MGWVSLDAAVDDAFKAYTHLIYALGELQQDPKSESAAKVLLKKMDNSKFSSILYIFRFMLPYSKTLKQNFSNWRTKFFPS